MKENIIERLLMGCKESNQTNKYTAFYTENRGFAVTTFFLKFLLINSTILKLLSLKSILLNEPFALKNSETTEGSL